MSGKDLLLKAIRNEVTERPAWLPFVGCHGASLIGASAEEYLKSSEKIAAGLRKARELYTPDGLPVVFDLQLEAEVLGCELKWAPEGPPSVASHPLAEGKSLADLPAFDIESGRIPVVMEALDTVKAEMGDEVALYGLICGPFTLALHMLGNDIFMEMFDNPEYVKAIVAYGAAIGKKMASAYLAHGADVIAVVDPMTSQICPEHFNEFVASSVNDIFNHVRAEGGYSSLFVCGDATRNLKAMSATTCDNLSIDENIPLELLRDITREGGKSLGGNLKLTVVLLLGTEDDSRLDALRCIDAGGGCGFILAPGCDLPFGTPPANLQAVSEVVLDDYKREVARRTAVAHQADLPETTLPDYASQPEVTIDLVTLDSATCAPCQYMVDAAKRAAESSPHSIAIAEHKVTKPEGIAMMMALGVSNIPTLCIEGEPRFVSLIPDQKTLLEALAAAAKAKPATAGA